MNRKSRQALIMAGVGLILGLLLSLQLKNVQAVGGSVALARVDELNGQIDALQQQNTELLDEIGTLQQQARQAEQQAADTQAQAQSMQGQLDSLKIQAGLTALDGPGITVIVDHRTVANGDVVKYVADTDLLFLVNELKAAGAEAIAVNGHRVGANTEIRKAGAYISINGHATGVPFTITALGDSQMLAAALNLYGGVVESLADYYDISVNQQNALTVPAFDGIQEFRYASAAEGQS